MHTYDSATLAMTVLYRITWPGIGIPWYVQASSRRDALVRTRSLRGDRRLPAGTEAWRVPATTWGPRAA